MDSLEDKGLALMTQSRALCRRCGQAFEIKDMTVFNAGISPWYMCEICGEDLDVYEER